MEIVASNYVASSYEAQLSLTGARLSDEFYSKVNKSASWATSSGYASQFDFELYNTGKSNLSNWTVRLDVPQDSVVENVWGCEAVSDIQNGYVYLKPTYYNDVIYAGENALFI